MVRRADAELTARWRGPPGLAVLIGLLGVLAAVVLPFAPVLGQSTVVQWPQAGQPPRPTTAFFVPYRPAELHATVPCPVLRAALARPGATRVLSTGSDDGGLVIESSGPRLRIATDGRPVPVTLAGTACDLRIDADSAATTVLVGGAVVAQLPGARVPEVFAFDTDLDAPAATGLAVTARTPYWFASTPTAWKYGLIAAQAALAAAALALLARRGRRSPRVRTTGPPRGRWLRGGVDAGVLVVLAGWGVIGPLTDDDGFAAMIARNAGAAGDTGNYYRWFNASEAPFGLAQQLVRAFAEVSITPLWLRVPSLLAGALTWLALHRCVLPLALHRATRTRARLLTPVAAVSFLAWWLPYGLGTRPEPFVALGSTLVLALVLAATSRAVRRPLLALGLAALLTTATVAVAPTGLLAAVPVLLSAPRIWRLLRENAGGRPEITARLALLGCIAATAITIMFADQSWHGVVVATDIHRYVGPDSPWFDEGLRYSALLGTASWGSAGKRLPVLLTLALLVPVLALLARHGAAVLERRQQFVLLASAPVGLALLALTPSKWTHHFGALVGLGPAFLVAAITAGVAGASRRDRFTQAIGLGGGVLVALATGVSFAGPNTWWGYSDFGMPFSDGPLWPLDNPLLWLAVACAVAVARALWRHRSAEAGPAGAGSAGAGSAGIGWFAGIGEFAAAPALLATLAAATSVTLLLATFLAAPLRRGDGYSLPAQNLADLHGTSCGIEDHIKVLLDYPNGVLAPAPGVDALDGFVAQGGYPESMMPPQPGARFVWGSATGGQLSTGTLRTAWFALPAQPTDQELAVSVAGRLGKEYGGANTAALEFGRSTPTGAVQPLGQRRLTDPEPAEHAYAADAPRRQQAQAKEREQALRSWRTRSVAPGAVPSGADRVRVLAVDGTVGEPGWVAVTGPRLISVVGLREFLDAHPPVLVDWPIAFVVPCRREVPTVAGGLAQAPAAILAVPKSPRPSGDLWSGGGAELAYETASAGSFAGVNQIGQIQTVNSRLTDDDGRYWGTVQLIDYSMARDAYDTHPVYQWLPGWSGDDTYRFN